MSKLLTTVLLLFFLFKTLSAKDTTLINKNIIGVDFTPFEGNNYNLFGGGFGMKYIRKLHKRADILTTLGLSYPIFPFGTISDRGSYIASVLGKFTLVPCYVPLRRNNKTLQLGVGYITEFQNKRSQVSLHGITTQFNFYKESKRRRFTIGTNIYINTMFTSSDKGQLYYGGGVGLFLGGFTGKKPQSK
jgi:hypothetical protein